VVADPAEDQHKHLVPAPAEPNFFSRRQQKTQPRLGFLLRSK